jgi:hypothetical protein
MVYVEESHRTLHTSHTSQLKTERLHLTRIDLAKVHPLYSV